MRIQQNYLAKLKAKVFHIIRYQDADKLMAAERAVRLIPYTATIRLITLQIKTPRFQHINALSSFTYNKH